MNDRLDSARRLPTRTDAERRLRRDAIKAAIRQGDRQPGSIILNDEDRPVCDVDGDVVVPTTLTSTSGSRLYRCAGCGTREWIGI